MNDRLHIVLTGDGPSDRSLLPIIVHALEKRLPATAIQPEWADLQRYPIPKKLIDRIPAILDIYPCEILFIHRDAEKEPYTKRIVEIDEAKAKLDIALVNVIPVIPVRMQEAWLLHDERAIRQAAKNPSGKMPLKLPKPNRVEDDPDPKETLYELLKIATGLTGRHLVKFSAPKQALSVSEYMTDFQSLDKIPAYRRLTEDIDQTLTQMGM